MHCWLLLKSSALLDDFEACVWSTAISLPVRHRLLCLWVKFCTIRDLRFHKVSNFAITGVKSSNSVGLTPVKFHLILFLWWNNQPVSVFRQCDEKTNNPPKNWNKNRLGGKCSFKCKWTVCAWGCWLMRLWRCEISKHMRLRFAHAVCEQRGGLGWAQPRRFHRTPTRGTVALYSRKAEEKLQLVSGLPSITESSGSAASGENEELSGDSASGQAPTF